MMELNSIASNKKSNKGKRYIENSAEVLFFIITTISILAVAVICGFIFANAIPAISKIGIKEFLLGTKWMPTATPPKFGILPMIVGSFYVTIGAIVIGVPIGIMTAIYMAGFANKKYYKLLKTSLNLMAGIPSIVYGFFALMVIVPFFKKIFGGSGLSLFTAMVVLGIMILPTIIGLSEAAIRAVPKSYYEGALALGLTHEYAMAKVVVPAAKSGVLSSVILGVGRAIGETMAVVMIAGNQAIIPTNILKGARTMTSNIILEMAYAAGLHREALLATGAILFIFILIINVLFNMVNRRSVQ